MDPGAVDELLAIVFGVQEQIAKAIVHVADGVDGQHGDDVAEELESSVTALLFDEGFKGGRAFDGSCHERIVILLHHQLGIFI